jgi:hypothetical protein
MKDYKTSRFKRRIRISEDNLEFVRGVKGKYTLAGMLDKIINQYKNGSEALGKNSRRPTPQCDAGIPNS